MSDVQVSLKIEDKVREAINNSYRNPEILLAIHNTLAKRCDPYVPFLNGPLSQTIQVTTEGVRYIQPYARRQYYGDDFNHTVEYHPLASARWDEAMMRDHGEEFKAEVQEIIRRGLRHG